MSASVVEQILARAKAALLAGATAAGTHIERGREEPFGDDELPGVNLRRGRNDHRAQGDNGTIVTINFEIEHHVAVTSGDWETAADALHMEVHVVLTQDSQLAALGRGLRCTGTDAQGDSADRVIGRLTASYQMQVFVRPGDLTRSIT